MTLFEHILIEGRIEDFKKLLDRTFNSEYVQNLINRDTSDNHKNLMWIGKILKNEPDLNIDELYKNLELFNRVGKSTDLYQFKDYLQFINFLGKKSKEVAMGKMQQIKLNSRVLANSKRWLVVVPESHEASKYFGGGTSWCISTSNDKHWKEYHHSNTIVMIKDRSRKPDDLLFKVAIVGNAENNIYVGGNEDKESKAKELRDHVDLYNTEDRVLNTNQSIEYLKQLPDDLLDDVINYFDDDDINERRMNWYYELAQERYDEGGKEELIKELLYKTENILDNDADLDSDDFYHRMSIEFKEQLQDGNFDEFLQQLWNSCIDYQGVEDDSFSPSLYRLGDRINDTSDYSYDDYIDIAKDVLQASADSKSMDNIIINSLVKRTDNSDPYKVLKYTYDTKIPGTNYFKVLQDSLSIYNARNNPNFAQGQMTLPGEEYFGITNKFAPRNIEDVIKVLNVNPKAKEMVDFINRYRKDLYESKKKASIRRYFNL